MNINEEILKKVRNEFKSLSISVEPDKKLFLDEKLYDNHIEYMLAKAITFYGHEINTIKWWGRLRNEPAFFPENGMYDWIEAQIVYLLIRYMKPKIVVEISPNYGYSTGFILLAMNKNNRGQLYSFDLDEKFYHYALQNFNTVGIDNSRQKFIPGDVREVYTNVLYDKIDLLFMDSDHSYSFAEWYILNLYPRIAEGGLIHAHDVLKYGVKPHTGDKGEGKALWELIQNRRIPNADFFYVSEFVRTQPLKSKILQKIERFPFEDTTIGTNHIEQNASLWLIKHF